MTNPNLIKVYGQGFAKYGHRQTYIDNHGESFTGTRADAIVHYRQLYPTMSIKISDSPRKRESR